MNCSGTASTKVTEGSVGVCRNDNSNPQQGSGTPGRMIPSSSSSVSDEAATSTKVTNNVKASNSNKPTPTKKDSRKLFVGGLPSDVTDREFREFFAQYGIVLDSVVMYDRETHRSRGFGFVTFQDPDVADRLLSMGQNKDRPVMEPRVGRLEMRGKTCEVKAAEPKESRPSRRSYAPHGAAMHSSGGARFVDTLSHHRPLKLLTHEDGPPSGHMNSVVAGAGGSTAVAPADAVGGDGGTGAAVAAGAGAGVGAGVGANAGAGVNAGTVAGVGAVASSGGAGFGAGATAGGAGAGAGAVIPHGAVAAVGYHHHQQHHFPHELNGPGLGVNVYQGQAGFPGGGRQNIGPMYNPMLPVHGEMMAHHPVVAGAPFVGHHLDGTGYVDFSMEGYQGYHHHQQHHQHQHQQHQHHHLPPPHQHPYWLMMQHQQHLPHHHVHQPPLPPHHLAPLPPNAPQNGIYNSNNHGNNHITMHYPTLSAGPTPPSATMQPAPSPAIHDHNKHVNNTENGTSAP